MNESRLYDNKPPPNPLVERLDAKNNTDHPLDFLISNGGLENDMANVFYRLYPKYFQYYGNNCWRWYDNGKKEWRPDNGNYIFEQMRFIYSNLLLERCYYWQLFAERVDDKILKAEASNKTIALVEIQNRLTNRKNNYAKNILKEMKAFYLVKEL